MPIHNLNGITRHVRWPAALKTGMVWWPIRRLTRRGLKPGTARSHPPAPHTRDVAGASPRPFERTSGVAVTLDQGWFLNAAHAGAVYNHEAPAFYPNSSWAFATCSMSVHAASPE